MRIWSISDLHLSLGNPSKDMGNKFNNWKGYTSKIVKNWRKLIHKEDYVLIAGDISWASKLEDAIIDLEWIDSLPAKKIIIKGNHDYWWSTAKKVRYVLPKSISIISNDAISFGEISICGTRLWDAPPQEDDIMVYTKQDLSIYNKELHRLRLSLSKINKDASVKIAMTHYPPLQKDLKGTAVTAILEEFGIDIVVFGHIHCDEKVSFGELNGIKYTCTSADQLDFEPILIYQD